MPGDQTATRLPTRLRLLPHVVEQSSPAVSRESRPGARLSGTSRPSDFKGQMRDQPSELRALLFSKRCDLKVAISRVAMHLSDARRVDLFKQIDDLLDDENWSDDDSLIDNFSFATFLRFVVYEGRLKRPALTVSPAGNIAASWFGDDHRLTVEFLRNDKIRCICRRNLPSREVEASAYEGPMLRLDDVLKPFDASGWYRDGTARLA